MAGSANRGRVSVLGSSSDALANFHGAMRGYWDGTLQLASNILVDRGVSTEVRSREKGSVLYCHVKTVLSLPGIDRGIWRHS